MRLPFDFDVGNIFSQEIIKVRERIPPIGPLAKVIPLKLFLDIAPSSSADITRALRGCFPGTSVHAVSFRFVSKQRKTSNAVGMSVYDILITIKGASVLAMF